ncbi:MAG: alpha/beta fold hydrolase [Cyanobacteriota/Melainabacteria group bacterium]
MSRLSYFLPIVVSLVLSCSAAFAQDSGKDPAVEPRDSSPVQFLSRFVTSIDPEQAKALELFQAGQIEEVRTFLNSGIEEAKRSKDPNREISLLYFLALLERWEDSGKKAIGHLHRIETIQSKRSDAQIRAQMTLSRRLGDCYYDDRKLDAAIRYYNAALISANYLNDADYLRQELLDCLAGCYIARGNYEKAVEHLEKLKELQSQDLQKSRAGNFGSVSDLACQGRYFWTLLQLGQCYRHLENADASKAGEYKAHLESLRPELMEMLESFVFLRMKLEKEGRLASIREEFLLDYLNQHNPSTAGDFLYEAYNSRLRLKSLPVIAWRDENLPPEAVKAAIVCVHGMGLENQAFTVFGKEMAGRGYFVCAIDARGFGSWLAAPGSEKIRFDDTIEDIKFVIDLIRAKQPDIPVFILGESMGGAIALRTAAKYDGFASGVIASVPSAERFQEKRMALGVAFHFLKNPSKPYRMMDSIASQATSRPELRASWAEDKKAKLKVSPKELLDFDIFMRSTEKACKDIEKTPAFIVQGLKDALVKPAGTFRMFDNIGNSDKDMFILGEAEHLIFETDKQCKILLDTLSTWLDEHARASAATKMENSDE